MSTWHANSDAESSQPSPLQLRTAVDAHYSDGRIGREMLDSEAAVRQAKASEVTPTRLSATASMTKPLPGTGGDFDEQKKFIANYYTNHFPYEQVHRLFSRGWVEGGPDPYKREYGWEGIGGSPFVRWKTCGTPVDLHTMVKAADCGKLNVGAMYTVDPSNRYRERNPMQPSRREFVIDIDLDDYGGISKDDLDACDRNWPLVAVGLEVVKQVLQAAFDFRHILPVYSGRRGGHLWVCDERACHMSDEERSAITAFLSPSEGKGKKLWQFLVVHPNFSAISCGLMVPFFRSVGVRPIKDGGLGFLELPFQRTNFLNDIHESVTARIGAEVCSAATTTGALNIIEAECKAGPSWKWSKYQAAIWELLGPRIDANVSKHANHTLKAPYSVHPKTGRVSVPILHDSLDQFPVAARAPLVRDLMARHVNPSKDTLDRSVESFTRFIDNLAASETEKWKPPSFEPPAKRMRVVHDLKGPTEPEDTEPLLTDYPRPAVLLQRQWTVKNDPDSPGLVTLYTKVIGGGPGPGTRVVIAPGQYPPFELEYKQGDLDNIVTQIASTADQAHTCTPLQSLDAGGKKFIMVLNHGEKTLSPKAHAYCSEMCERLERNVEVCKLNMEWGTDALKSFIRQTISPYVTDLYSPRAPRPPADAP